MTIGTMRILAVCAAALVAPALLAAPLMACDSGTCAQSKRTAAPLKLSTFMRKPIATAAARAVKKRDGSYAQVSLTHHVKRRPVAALPATATLAPEAAEAFASQAASLVRVVSPGELNEIDLAAAAAPLVTTAVEVVNEPAVQVVSADEVNHIDRAADNGRAVSLDELNRTLAAPDKPSDNTSFVQRMLIVLGGAFAVASAAVRMLIG